MQETNVTGGLQNEYIFFNGTRTARRDSGGIVFYYFGDHLRSSRVIVQAGQTAACYEADYYPFGGERIITNTCSQNYKFTGKERDAESGLDYFGARHYSSTLGRFSSVDPGRLNLKHLINPQKWNKYTYTLNNPVRFFDPDGMEEIEIQLRTFIPQQSVSVLGRRFAGDNRSFSAAGNASSRTSITIRIETDPSRRANPILSVSTNVGQTVRLDGNGKVVGTGTATSGLPTVTGGRDLNGNVVLNFQQDTKNPLSPAPQSITPGISTDLTVAVPQNASSVTAVGTTSGFPAVELNVTPQGQPTTNIPINNPAPNASPYSLFTTNTVLASRPLPPPPPPCATEKDGKCQ